MTWRDMRWTGTKYCPKNVQQFSKFKDVFKNVLCLLIALKIAYTLWRLLKEADFVNGIIANLRVS